MDRVIVITGGSRGIGKATAIIAAHMGVNLVLVSRSEYLLNETVKEISILGANAIPVCADVSSPKDCRRVVSTTIRHYGRIDALVNNAGTLDPIERISTFNPEEWQTNWAVNVLGPVALTQAAIPHLRKSKGRIINVSSGASIEPVPGWSAYCCAKAAINHFTRALAAEEPLITALALRPGVVDTRMQELIRLKGRKGMPRQEYRSFVRLYEQGKLLRPEVTGHVIAVLSLYAPKKWSGEYISWDDERIHQLRIRHPA